MMRYMAAVIVLLAVVVAARGVFVLVPMANAHTPHTMPMKDDSSRQKDQYAVALAPGLQVEKQIKDLQARVAASPSTMPILAQGKTAPVQVVAAGVHQYHLSLVYYGNDYRRAVIDDRMLAEGDHMPSGGRVVAIHEDRVLVRDRNGPHTLVLPSAKLRVGSVRTVVPARNGEMAQP